MNCQKVLVDGTQLAAEHAGTGPAVLLLHAGIATRRMWDPQWSWLTESFQAIRFDQRGFGDSPQVPGSFSSVGDAAAVLDALDVEQAVVVGCSYGGATALHLALTHPTRVTALILVGSGVHGYEDPEPLPELFDEMENAWNAGNYERVLDLEEQAWVIGLQRSRDQLSPELLKLCREMNRTKLPWESVQATYEDGAADDAAHLADVSVPTLVVVGDEDVPDIQRQARFIAGRIPGARLEVIPDAAHLPNLEKPQAFDAIVRPWLATLQ